MIMLQILLVITVLSLINCFQFAAAILAQQIGRSFWRWFGISLFLPIISLIILIFLWDTNQQGSTTNQ
jgi:hypothetical protein